MSIELWVRGNELLNDDINVWIMEMEMEIFGCGRWE